MDVVQSLIESGVFSVIDMILLATVGILIYFLSIKKGKAESYVNSTIEGMKIMMDEEKAHTQELSRTVGEIRKDMERERDEKWILKEQILTLKAENERLKLVVADLEHIVANLREENNKLLKQIELITINNKEE